MKSAIFIVVTINLIAIAKLENQQDNYAHPRNSTSENQAAIAPNNKNKFFNLLNFLSLKIITPMKRVQKKRLKELHKKP